MIKGVGASKQTSTDDRAYRFPRLRAGAGLAQRLRHRTLLPLVGGAVCGRSCQQGASACGCDRDERQGARSERAAGCPYSSSPARSGCVESNAAATAGPAATSRPTTEVPTARPGVPGVLRQRASASGSGRGSSSRSRVKVRPSARGMGSLPVPYLWVCAAM